MQLAKKEPVDAHKKGALGFYSKGALNLGSMPSYFTSGNTNAHSKAAVSSASEPCTAFLPTLSA